MSAENTKNKNINLMPTEEEFYKILKKRHQRGLIGRFFNYFSIFVAILTLVLLFGNVVNEAIGTIAVQNEIDPETLTEGRDLTELSNEELGMLLAEYVPNRLRVIIRDNISVVPTEAFTSSTAAQVVGSSDVDPAIADQLLSDITAEQQAGLLADYSSSATLRNLVLAEIVKEQVVASYPLSDTIFNYPAIEAKIKEDFPEAEILRFYSWLNNDFITTPMSSTPSLAGIRTALLGSIYMMILVVLIALPIGVGAAIYLEEYAEDTPINRLIETNIRNLAGVPSIIYGMLGLAVFVRAMEPITSGAAFGVTGGNGRTILSAALTLALLILPIIIINAQEALRAVPWTIREASYGLGATRWQTIWNQVLPASLPGIMTGTILAISRAVGETAPLIVVGAATFLLTDPTSPFSKFTAMPIQVYQWTARPQEQFRDIAAAAIIVLLVLMLTLNAAAILLRNRYSIRY